METWMEYIIVGAIAISLGAILGWYVGRKTKDIIVPKEPEELTEQ